jgi:hypothetical protein
MTGWHDLPPELTEHIISLVFGPIPIPISGPPTTDDEIDSDTKEHLRNLQNVSREWAIAARKRLYSQLTLREAEEVDAVLDLIEGASPELPFASQVRRVFVTTPLTRTLGEAMQSMVNGTPERFWSKVSQLNMDLIAAKPVVGRYLSFFPFSPRPKQWSSAG